ncbi:hypothetical protein KOAAANKH_02711 [Brevundimonas sp. NIBR10]|uniref:hypothetical protein n=1 Tax=Brevundimonas sp. NIBR10 TaxID=3015997 RepID=UPI0022F153B5|nr:hypothetical protein [Brevundimonas sp. NIBR10]WGM47826.1 hypothetical protein KOAAANKH_02711 [Brevundimonas sp. NIBR10]
MSFEALLSKPFRWPQAGDRLFTVSPDWDGNATLVKPPHSRMVLMMTGYKRAGDLMVAHATDDRGDRDTLVFPILFNYRQFIELSLKYLIATYGPSVEVEAIWKSHDLSVLWTRFRTVVEGFGVADPDGADEAVGRIVAEFAVVDPGSFSHRYPVDTKGRPIALALDHVDLVALADVMNTVDDYFTGCDGYLDALESAAP